MPRKRREDPHGRYRQRVEESDTLGGLLDFVPVVGDVKGVVEALDAFSKGQLVAGGILAAGTVAGLVPIVGDFASKASKVLAKQYNRSVSPEEAAAFVRDQVKSGRLDPALERLYKDLDHQVKRFEETGGTVNYETPHGVGSSGYTFKDETGEFVAESGLDLPDTPPNPRDAFVTSHELGHSNHPFGRGKQLGTGDLDVKDGIVTKAGPGVIEGEISAWRKAAADLMRHNPTQATIDKFMESVNMDLGSYVGAMFHTKTGNPYLQNPRFPQELAPGSAKIARKLKKGSLTINDLIGVKPGQEYTGPKGGLLG